jgi:transcriptional regulator with XRE-family HTH domain
MDKQKNFHKLFLDRLCDAIEPKLQINRHDRGFKRELAKALGLRDSTVQRWFISSTPAADHLMKIYDKFNITPNQLFGIEEPKTSHSILDLHKINFIVGARSKNLPDELLDDKYYTISPILKSHEAAAHLNNLTESDIESWGITRNDLSLNRKTILAFVIFEKVDGTSMYPVLKHGDLVVIDPSDIEIIDDAIYAIRTTVGEVVCRQIKKSNNTLILIPWNLKDYKPELLDLNENPNAVIGRVIFSVSYFARENTETQQ